MRHFTQLSYREREKIYRGLCAGKSIRQIAKELGRAPSTISREIARNSDSIGYLYAGDAHKVAEDRRNKNIRKIDNNKKMRKFIILKLHDRWSPAVIAASWNKKKQKTISKEAIYQWIYSDEGESMKLRKQLVRARKRRGLKPRRLRQSRIKHRISIHERPESINQRKEVGHYECDLIFNKGSQSQNICTVVERVTRKSFFIFNGDKTTKTVIKSLIRKIKKLGIVVKSITFDNGSEFAEHYLLKEMGIKTYFCDPGSPWQKGSIENLNGIARRFIPFSLSASSINSDLVEYVSKKLNNMPRAILAYKTPNQAFKNKRKVG